MNMVLLSVIVSLIITSVIGGLITGALFYFLSGKQLKREAQQLNRLSTLILHSLKESGLVDLNYGSAGKVIGIKFKAAPFTAGMHRMSGDLTAEKKSASNR